jgi:hypothetical protein
VDEGEETVVRNVGPLVRISLRLLVHICAVSVLWVVAASLDHGWPGLSFVPHVGSWILHGLAQEVGINWGEGSWYFVAFVMYYGFILWPVVWNPSRSIWSGILVMVVVGSVVAIIAFLLLVYAMGVSHE